MTLLSNITLSLFLLFSAYVSANSKNDVAAYYEKALNYFDDKEYSSSIISLKNALKINPKHLPSRVLLGDVYVKKSDGISAEKELVIALTMGADENLIAISLAKALNLQHKYDQIIKLYGSKTLPSFIHAEVNFELGQAYLLTGEVKTAENLYQKILDESPNNALGLQGKALVLMSKGKFFEAKDTAFKAHAVSTDKAQTFYLLGQIENSQLHTQEANEYFNKTLSIAPEHYNARLDRAYIKLKTQSYNEAISDLKRLIKKAPYDAKPHYLLGVALRKLGQNRNAKNAFLAAENAISDYSIEVKKKNIPTLLLAASIAVANNKAETAIDFYQIFLKQAPDNIEINKVVAKLYLQSNNAYKAIKLLISLGTNGMQDSELYRLLGDAYQAEKRYLPAIQAYQAALYITPNNPALLAKLGQSQVLVGHNDKGFSNLETALAQQPKSRNIGIFLAMQYFKSGQLTHAKKVTSGLLKNNTENLSVLSLHASILASLGNMKEAREHFNKILSINPKYRSAKLNLIKMDINESREEQARQSLMQLLSEQPKDLVLLYEQVKLEEMTGNTEKAIRLLEKLRALSAKNIAINLHLVKLYTNTKKTKEAIEIAEKLHHKNPKNFQVMEALGQSYLNHGDVRSAKIVFLRMSREAGYDPNNLFKAALLQVTVNDLDEARYSLSKAIEAKPNFYTAILTLTELEIQTNRFEAAENHITTLSTLAPNNPNSLLLQASLAGKKGLNDVASSLYEQAHKIMNTEKTMQLLFQSKLAVNKVDEALDVLQVWSDSHTQDERFKMTIADIQYQQGKHKKSIPYYEKLVANKTATAVIYGRLAIFYTLKDDIKALKFAKKAYKLLPTNEYIIDTYGWMLVKHKKYNEALILLREAVSRNSSEPQIHYHLGVALEQLGNKRQALKSYRAALSFNTKFKGIEDAKIALKNLN